MARIVDATKFVALGSADKRPTKVSTSSGEADLIADIYQPVVNVLTSLKNGAGTVGDILADKRCSKLNRGHIWEALLVLTGSGFVGPASSSETKEADTVASQSLNKFICKRAEYTDQMRFLAAPAIGSAISVSRIDQLFLRAHELEASDVPVWVWGLLDGQGQRLVKDNETLEGSEANVAELRLLYGDFIADRQLMLQAVGAVKTLQPSS